MAPGHSIFVPLAEFLSKSCTNLKFLIEPSVCPHKKQSYQWVGQVASIHRAAEKSSSRKPEDETVLHSSCVLNASLKRGSYCNKRRRMRTSTIMIRATITPLPSWNALRRSYLKLLLFLLRPIVLLSLCSLAVGRTFRSPRSISLQDGVWC